MKPDSKTARVSNVMKRLEKIWRVLRSVLSQLQQFLQRVSRFALRMTGALFALGGVIAIIGWLLARLNPQPLAATWLPALWLVTVGILLLIVGMLALYTKHFFRAGMIGQCGLMLFLFGAVVLIAGAWTIDGFILPSMFKLINQIPNLSAPLQGAIDTTTQGINSTGSGICNTLTNPFGGSSSCSSSPVPGTKVPTLDGPTLVNSILAKLGLPSLSTLGTLGLVFLSGSPLALGCMVLALAFLLAGQKPRSALLLVIICAFFNLAGQFLVDLSFFGPLDGILLYISLVWLGLTLWFPEQVNGLTSRLFGKAWQQAQARLAPSVASSDSPQDEAESKDLTQ